MSKDTNGIVAQEVTTREPAITDPGDHDLDGLVQRICQMKRNSTLILAIDVGMLIVEQIFGGSVALSQSSYEHPSFRRLASHPDVPFSRATLWRYVGAYHIAARLPWVVSNDILTIAHLSTIASLALEEQEALLRIAAADHWTAKRLASAVQERNTQTSRERSTDRMGAKALAVRLERLQKQSFDLRLTHGLRECGRDRVQRIVHDTRQWCDALETWANDTTQRI